MSHSYTGKVIGDCTIKNVIGEGGGGKVFLASHPVFGKEIILKILAKMDLNDNQSKQRFEREIKISTELNHQNITKVFQADSDEEYFYIIMEYIDGSDIEEDINKHGVYKAEKAIKITLDILSALDYAHSKNIIHRDIKPSNILLNTKGIAKLCDFGLAKDLKIESDLTVAGKILGTPNFMSPEQWFGAKDLTSQSDIFSLGASLFYMLTEHKPFEASDVSKIMSNSLFGEPPKLDIYVKGVTKSLSKVLDKMLARDLKERYTKVKDVIIALQTYTDTKKSFLSKLWKK